jgi:hypothetical protein
MLPHHMLIREHVSGKKYDNGYLYNFADLLIVDEAGQVLPEVAAASFALAKKALVIGDTEQIAPIWNSLPCIDIGNMVEGISFQKVLRKNLLKLMLWCVNQERALHPAAL